MLTAKGLTNGVIPMGAVIVKKAIYDAFMSGPEHMIELFHGYTYSGNPVAAAAGLATLDTYAEEGLLTRGSRARALLGERTPRHEGPAARHRHPQRRAGRRDRAGSRSPARPPSARSMPTCQAFEKGLLIRTTGDIIALSPPLIVAKAEIDRIFETLAGILKALD